MSISMKTRKRRGAVGAGIAVASLVTALGTGVSPAAAATSPTPESRAQALLAQMTLEEKVDMLEGERNNYYGFYNAPIERLGIPALTMADGPAGVRIANPDINDKKATALPAPLALAATFDTSAATSFGDVIGDEAFKTTHNVSLGTAVDIARVGVAGRAFEGYGEDPLLAGKLAGAQISAIQSHNVMADIKHYNVYNQEEDRLVGGNAVIGERALQEIYTRPFAIGQAEGDPATAMCSFNKVNFVYACANSELMDEILRHQLDFTGYVMSDYGATHAGQDILSGLDQEQPSFGHFNWLVEAVQNGEIPESVVDTATLRVLTAMFKYGLFDHPAVAQEFDEVGHGLVSQKIAEESIVLLKNDGLLPLDADSVDSVAVIGADADLATAGGGSSLVLPTSTITPLQGIKDMVPDATVEHTRGTDFVTSSSLLPGLDAIPSDYLRSASGEPGVDVDVVDSAGQVITTKTLQNITLNGGFFYFEGFNAQSPLLPRLPRNGTEGGNFSTTLTAPVSGTYELELVASGSTTVTLDGATVLQTGATALETDSVSVDLVGGQEYSLAVGYIRDTPRGTDTGPQLKLGWKTPEGVVTPRAQAAAESAARSDVAVVVVRDYGTEGGDKADMGLPNGQEALIDAVKAANPNTVVVLTTGGPTTTAEWEAGVPSVLEAWYGGQNQGAALANILFGKVSPSGKLPVTFPVTDDATPVNTPEQYPGIGRDSYYTEGVFVGYRGHEHKGIPAQYPFGHGLSYTSFNYSDLKVTSTGKKVTASFTVTNTGDRAGAEAPQVYTGELPTDVVQTAPKQLAAFTKVQLQPGESKQVELDLDLHSYSYWDSYADRWVTPKGDLKVMVGASSQDIRLDETVKVKSSDKENISGIDDKVNYAIVNEGSGACLGAENRATAPGTAVQQSACPAPGPDAQFTLELVQAQGKDYYRFTNVNAGLVLQPKAGSSATGAGMELATAAKKNEGGEQQFSLVRIGDGNYQVVNRASGLCVAVDGGSRDNGVAIVMASCAAGTAQSFGLKPQR